MPPTVPGKSNLPILVYVDTLLAPSLAFILTQSEALQKFLPIYIGVRQLGSGALELPADRTLAINRFDGLLGKIREMPYRRFGYAPMFFRKIGRCAPVLLHAHFGPNGLRAVPLASWLGIPLVTTFHGFDATIRDADLQKSDYGQREYVRKRSILKERGSLFIAVSRFIRNRLLDQGFAEEKIVVHYMGVDTDFFCPDSAVHRLPIVLFVGHLTEQKGCDFLIQAMARVQALKPDVELVVIGEGSHRGRLEALAQEQLKLFRFLGSQPRAIVKDWLNRARVFSVPSVTAASGAEEGFGLVFAEAQAMGCPVASFSSGGIPEAVAHEETGLLTAERDIEGLAQHILALMRNDDMWQKMSQAGRARVCALFDLKVQTRSLEGLYRQVLNGAVPAQSR
jgi:colanic acid/amylovoran biosynthesis glycosyltransferase